MEERSARAKLLDGEGATVDEQRRGGVDPELRADSARRTVDIGFDGYAIGGLSVGEDRSEMVPALAEVTQGLLMLRTDVGYAGSGPIRIDAPATLQDIAPTLFDYAGFDPAFISRSRR